MAPREVPGDASTLIYLAKADAFTEASTCIRTILVTPAVWREAVEEGERIGAPEVGRIRAAQERGLLRRVALSPDAEVEAEAIRASHRLGLGESEVWEKARSSLSGEDSGGRSSTRVGRLGWRDRSASGRSRPCFFRSWVIESESSRSKKPPSSFGGSPLPPMLRRKPFLRSKGIWEVNQDEN